jgi:hypothetical protein
VRFKVEYILALLGVLATLGAAVGGAWIGGSLANNGARDLLREQAKRDKDRQTDAARAVARVVLVDVANLGFSVSAAASGACWWPWLDYTFKISPDDQKLLAAELSPLQWYFVTQTLIEAKRISIVRRNGFQFPKGKPSDDMLVAKIVIDRVRRTTTDLKAFADVPKVTGQSEEPQHLKRYRKTLTGTGYRSPACRDRASRP